MKFRCPFCGRIQTVNRLESRVLSITHAKRKCIQCGEPFVGYNHKLSRSVDIRRSRAQEKRAAERFGGVRQKASGSLPGIKGDVRLPGEIRMECKFTRHEAYSLRLKDLRSLEQQASAKEDPVIEIEFQGVVPSARYIVMPEWLYQHYRERRSSED